MIQRRDFLLRAAAPAIVPARVFAQGNARPSNRIALGMVGVGRMGSGHLRAFLGRPDVRVAAICDVSQERRERAKAQVDAAYGDRSCAVYNDFRELMARPDIDAICNATTEHWHGLVAIEAARRGKHLYSEKPMTMTVAESHAVRKAVLEAGVVFQHGTQQRSGRDYRHTVELAWNGYIGEVKSFTVCGTGGTKNTVGPEVIKDPPPGFDYDLWLGPAPWIPYSDERVSLLWQEITDYAYGHIDGMWGVHDIDIAQWLLAADAANPVEVEATGLFLDDMRDSVYSWTAEHKYANGARLIHCDRVSARRRAPQFSLINTMSSLVEGTEGWILVSRRGMVTHPASLATLTIKPHEKRAPLSDDHKRNFLDAIRTGQPTISTLESAVRDTATVHQALAALKLRRRLRWDDKAERFADDPQANTLLSRPMRTPWSL